MASFKDIHFSPAEFANLAKIDRGQISALEAAGVLTTVRRKIGNVERKMIALEGMQGYFRKVRESGGRHGDQANPVSASVAGAVAAAAADAAAVVVAGQTEDGNSTETETATQTETGFSAVATATAKPLTTAKNKIQMFYNVKGGTGKSTLTAQYAMRAAMSGLKVLAVDLDGQGHLAVNLDVLDAHERPTIYDVLINDLPIQDAVMNVAPGLDLIPGNLGLCNIEIPLNHKPRREYRLSEALAKVVDQYDLIVADTNPAASILNSSMLVATQLVIIVCATNPLSFHGMSLVMSTIEEMEREFRRELNVKIIPNLYDNREVISQEVLGELRAQFPEYCTRAVINRSADLNEATKRRTTVWDVSTKGVAAQDINALTEELLFT